MKITAELQEDFTKLKNEMEPSFPLEETWSKLEVYLTLLSRWSKKINLISPRDLSVIATKHLGQALLMAPFVSSVPNRVILDLGSGAGLPAIPLRIALPEPYFILVESRRKRANFLRQVIRSLSLDRIDVVNKRIEDWQGVEGGVDLVTARAVASPEKMRDMVRSHLSPNGWILTPLSEDAVGSIDRSWRVERNGIYTTLGLFR